MPVQSVDEIHLSNPEFWMAPIEEREAGTLNALLVTPLSEVAYLRWRVGIPLLACTAVTLAAFWIAGLAAVPWPWQAKPWQPIRQACACGTFPSAGTPGRLFLKIPWVMPSTAPASTRSCSS